MTHRTSLHLETPITHAYVSRPIKAAQPPTWRRTNQIRGTTEPQRIKGSSFIEISHLNKAAEGLQIRKVVAITMCAVRMRKQLLEYVKYTYWTNCKFLPFLKWVNKIDVLFRNGNKEEAKLSLEQVHSCL